jgi:hypothetical protein
MRPAAAHRITQGARPGGLGQHQPTEFGQGKVGTMPSLTVLPVPRLPPGASCPRVSITHNKKPRVETRGLRVHAATRFQSVAAILIVVLPMTPWAVPPAAACPFCGTVGQSLAQRRDAADAVAVAEAEGTAAADASGFLAQRFRIDQVLRDTAHAAVAGETVPARVAGPIAGTAVLFGTAMAAGPQAAEKGHSWSAVAADETLLGYVTAAPAITLPAAERLRWFATRLEHPDPAIAADAFTEFGLSPFTAVRAAASGLDPVRLRAWVSEPGIDARRRGLYGLLLGVAAATTDDPAMARDCIDALHRAVEAPADDFRAGFDGVLAGVLVAEGQAGLDSLERRGLFGREARALDQRHLLAAVRFAGESLTETIPRERIVVATAALLASPAMAADATVDLARYQAWDMVADISRLWDTLGTDDPLVRRAVAGYLAACPLPAARQELERIGRQNPGVLKQALDAAALPAGR